MNQTTKWKQTHEAKQRQKGFVKIHEVWVPADKRAEFLEIARKMRAQEDSEPVGMSVACRIYNMGYMAGHEDTVEARFTPVHHSEMDSDNADNVRDIIEELVEEQRQASEDKA